MASLAGDRCRGSFGPIDVVELEASEPEASDGNTSGASTSRVTCVRLSKAWHRGVGIIAMLAVVGLWFGWPRFSQVMDQQTSIRKRNDSAGGGEGIVSLDQRRGGVGNLFENIVDSLTATGLNPVNDASMDGIDERKRSVGGPEVLTTAVPLPVLMTTGAPQVQTQFTTTQRECHTTVPGEDCYDQVYWAATVGIHEHPEWYVSLGPDSPVELFQGILARRGKCPKPCDTYTLMTRTTTSVTTTTTTPRPWQYPALFCFSVAMKDTYEMDIMMKQRAEGVGIFACEESAVLCENKTDLGGGVTTITFKHADVGKSKDGTAGNARLFMNAWHAVHEDGRYLKTQFVVKMDPDAVLLPDRLRPRVEDHIMEGPVFFLNCNRYPDNPDYPMMYGAMEVYSTSAITAYIKGEARCKKELPIWPLLGEDSFMTKCLERLDVKAVLDNDMVSDDRCFGIDCKDPHAAGFHEFKNVDGWFHCLAQAKEVKPEKSTAQLI